MGTTILPLHNYNAIQQVEKVKVRIPYAVLCSTRHLQEARHRKNFRVAILGRLKFILEAPREPRIYSCPLHFRVADFVIDSWLGLT